MGGVLSVSTEYHTIGETSIKSGVGSNGTCSLDSVYLITSQDIGKEYTVSFDAYCTNVCTVSLFYRVTSGSGSATLINTLSMPENISNHIVLTLNRISEGIYSIFFRVINTQKAPCYVTNVDMRIQ